MPGISAKSKKEEGWGSHWGKRDRGFSAGLQMRRIERRKKKHGLGTFRETTIKDIR